MSNNESPFHLPLPAKTCYNIPINKREIPMSELLYILREISLPIILLIAVGFGFQKIFKTDVRTFSKLLIYLITPVVIFTKIYAADITMDFFLLVVPFVLAWQVCMLLISLGVSGMLGYKKSMRNALSNVLVLSNTGNYGFPLNELVFSANPTAAAAQLFIMVTQNITGQTYGVFNVSSGSNATRREAILHIFKMPSIYVLALVIVFKFTGVIVPQPILIPLNYIAKAFIAIALITLGVQLAGVKIGHHLKPMLLASILKVGIAPLLGFGLVLLFGIQGLLAKVLIIAMSTPTAVNTAILAKEFNNEPDYSAQIVVLTTIFCTFTLPVIIYFVQQYF